MSNVTLNSEKSIAGAIKIDENEVKGHLSALVKQSVEETLNGLLSAEADALCQASRYQRSPDRQDTRAGSYKRKVLTGTGEVELQMPRLRSLPFETQIIERYKRKESGVEEALVEMYLAEVSVRRVEDITEALWGARVSPSTVSELNKRFMVRSNNGASSRSLARIRIFFWTDFTSSAAGAVRCKTFRCWWRSG